MSSIPYNYGKYIDDTVRLKDQGVVDAKNQLQSPASAGSRGLTKTTQFTKDKTQMQLGQEAIAESMVEIRSILNRIDGVNAPVQENEDDWTKLMNAVAERYGKEKARVIHDYVQYGTDSGPELMKDHGLTPGDGMEENQREWFKKFPWLEKLDKTSWMDRLINIAGEGPEYGGAEFKYPKGLESVSEDAGEGHMSKSTLYHTAKYAIALMDMIKKGDDLEGWVQSKLNKAADYLQGAYNYEEYQKLNPYREELDNNMIARHSQIIQKNIDEILDKETEVDDIDTKPGMMRILAKRVNEVEKKLAKETRKQDEGKMSDIDTDMKSMSDEDFMKKYKKSKEQMKKDLNEDGHMDVPSAIRNCETIIEDAMQMKQKLQTMEGELPSWMTQMIAVAASDLNDARDYLLNPTTESGIMYRAGVKKYGKKGMTAIQSAAGKGASHQEIGKIKDKFIKDEEQFDEGLKDWAKGLAMAGVIVAGLAGVGSIQNAIDNSVPAVQAMNKAYEMAMDAGNTELADMIKKDLSAVKVRLDSGKDLNFVKAMQEKYGKFMTTEGLAYESKLAVLLNQRIK